MAQPESVVVDAIRRALGGGGPNPGMGHGGLRCVCIKMHGSAFTRDGFPDLVVIRPDGVTIYLEVKVPGRVDGPLRNGVDAAQLSWGKRIKRQGAEWGFASTVDEAILVVFPG